MKITKELLDELSQKAQQSPRLRVAMDMRTDANDQSQRMLNALEPGTAVPVHRHRHTTETMIVLRGRLMELLYDEEGNLTDRFEMAAGSACAMIQLEKGQFHSLECLESGTVIFEAKDGAYAPLPEEDVLNIK